MVSADYPDARARMIMTDYLEDAVIGTIILSLFLDLDDVVVGRNPFDEFLLYSCSNLHFYIHICYHSNVPLKIENIPG